MGFVLRLFFLFQQEADVSSHSRAMSASTPEQVVDDASRGTVPAENPDMPSSQHQGEMQRQDEPLSAEGPCGDDVMPNAKGDNKRPLVEQDGQSDRRYRFYWKRCDVTLNLDCKEKTPLNDLERAYLTALTAAVDDFFAKAEELHDIHQCLKRDVEDQQAMQRWKPILEVKASEEKIRRC